MFRILAEGLKQNKCLKFTVTLENGIKLYIKSGRIACNVMFHGQVLPVVYGNICLRDLSTLTLNLFGSFSLILQ